MTHTTPRSDVYGTWGGGGGYNGPVSEVGIPRRKPGRDPAGKIHTSAMMESGVFASINTLYLLVQTTTRVLAHIQASVS